MASDLPKLLSEWIIGEYLTGKRTFDAVEHIILLAKAKPFYDNDFASDAFYSMVGGVILALCKTDEALRVRLPVGGPACVKCGKGTKTKKPGPIGKLLKANLGKLRRDGWKYGLTEESWADMQRKHFEPIFDDLFPDVVGRGGLSPTIVDLAKFSERVSTAVQPVRDHRNTLTAHRGKTPKPATFDNIRNAFATLDPLLQGLYLVATGDTELHMKLGGVSDPAIFAKAFVDIAGCTRSWSS